MRPIGAIRPVAALRGLAALAAGAGGLTLEVAAIRRHGLLAGNTAEAATTVVGVFVLGLGVGSLWIARTGAGPRPLWRAACAYAAVAAVALLWHLAAPLLPPLGPWTALAAAAAFPGVAAVAMGVAFPCLFAGVAGRAGPGLLIAANLAGSVIAAWGAAMWAIPEIGIAATGHAGAGLYALAAAAAAVASRGGVPDAAVLAPDPPERGARRIAVPGAGAALASGLLLIGAEIVLLRRMPFFLEGFRPTLAGVLAACLAAATLGAIVAGRVAARIAPGAGRSAAALALAVGALGVAAGVVEHVGAPLGRLPVATDLGYHLRIAVAALAAGFVPCAAAGAVVPLLLADAPPPRRAERAGALFFAQGIGSLGASLLVGSALPELAPTAWFVVAPLAVAVGAALGAGAAPLVRGVAIAAALLLAALGVTGPGSPWDPVPPIRGSRWDRPGALVPLAHRTDRVTTATVAYDRVAHSMVLFTDEFRAAETGPGTAYMRLLGHLPFLLRDDLGEVAVIALGTGTTAAALVDWTAPRTIHVVEISPAVLSLVDRFAGDGPVPTGAPAAFRVDPRTAVHVTDGRRWLAGRAEASLDLVTMEPLLPYAPGTAALYSREFYALAASRLTPRGLCVQWVPTHAMPAAMFDTLLATFGDAFAHTSLWLVDDSTLLVGSAEPHLDDLEAAAARLAAAAPAARATLHEAGVASGDDLLAACVGRLDPTVLAAARRLGDDVPFLERIGYWSGADRLGFLPANLARLAAHVGAGDAAGPGGAAWDALRRERLAARIAAAEAWSDPAGERLRAAARDLAAARSRAPGSVLLHAEFGRVLDALLALEIARADPPAAARLARGQLDRRPGGAMLRLAAVGDLATDDPRYAAGVAAALALDPTLTTAPPGAPGDIAGAVSPLEDLAALPDGVGLAAQVVGERPRAVAIRVSWPVRAARALVAVAASRPLDDAERATLRPLLDPESLRMLARAVAARGGDVAGEVLPLWRPDFAAPPEVVALGDGTAAQRAALAAALGGRRDPGAVELLARALQDADPEVRRAAAAALLQTAGERIDYDPDGPESARRAASERLRGLYHRRP